MKTVVGLFDSFENAQNAVHDLRGAGFAGEDISMVARDQGGQYAQYLQSGEKQNIGDGAAAGAGIGAVLGGLGGLLVGLGALAIPGIGPVIAAGPIITTLGGAGVGAIAGGIVGALVDLGIPEEHANMYAEGIRRGGTLVVARTSDEMADQAADIMNRYSPVDIDSRASGWRNENNWTTFDQNAPEYDYSQKQNQGSNIPVTGDQPDQSSHMGSHMGQPDQGDMSQSGRGYGVTGTGAYGTDRDYNTPTGGVGDRGMETGNMNQESTASDQQHDWRNDQGRRDPFTGNENMGSSQNTGVNSNMGMGDNMDDENNKDIPVTGSPDVLYSETVVDEDIEPVDDNWSYFDNRFRSDYNARYGSTGSDYSTYQPAYRFGYDLASDPQYRNWDWNQLEPVAQQQWQSQGLSGRWEDFKDYVRDAWDRVTNG